MSDSSGGNRNILLDRLQKEASVDTNSADDYSIRAWITSAKKCLDQAEEDMHEGDLEAAYINYLKAISIVVEVIPRHRGMKELEERKTSLALDYWIFRSRVSIAFQNVQRLKEQLQNSINKDNETIPSSTTSPQPSRRQEENGPRAQSPRSFSKERLSSLSNARNSTIPKFPKRRPVLSSERVTLDRSDSPVSNGVLTRPSSVSSSVPGSSRLSSQLSQPPDDNQHLRDTKGIQTPAFPKANVIEPNLLLSYLSQPQTARPSILLLDVRPKEQYETGCLNADHVVWIDPILLDEEKSGRELEESLVLCPVEQQNWFSDRHLFDLVVIYDENSRLNSYAGGPVLDIHQVRLRNLTVAIFDYAGFLKPLKHVPMLLIGGIEAWCRAVYDSPLRIVRLDSHNLDNVHTRSPNWPSEDKPNSFPELSDIDRQVDELDLDAESQWLESLHSERSGLQIRSSGVDGVDQKKLNRSVVISSSPYTDQYNKSLLDFFQNFPNVEPESMSMAPQHRSRPASLEQARYPKDPATSRPTSLQTPQRRQSTFIDHPWHGFTEVKDPEFQPPTPSKKSADRPFETRPTVESPSQAAGGEEWHSSGRSRIPSVGSQISQVGPVSAGMTGLKNLGNTCYMNSVLQCMSATVPLARYFLSKPIAMPGNLRIGGNYRRSINVDNPLGSKGLLANTFAELIKHLWSDQYTHISPVTLRNVVGKLQPRFKNSDQQDAQDFLAWLLDGLHEDLNENALKSKLRELTSDEERRRERMPLADVSDIEWDRYKHNHKSFLVELFQGQFVSSLKCSVCGQTSTTCNAFMNLSIEISLPHGPQGLQLTQCIDAFVKEEVLDGDNAWYSPSACGSRDELIKQELSKLQEASTCYKAITNSTTTDDPYYTSETILLLWAMERQAQHFRGLSYAKSRLDKICASKVSRLS